MHVSDSRRLRNNNIGIFHVSPSTVYDFFLCLKITELFHVFFMKYFACFLGVDLILIT